MLCYVMLCYVILYIILHCITLYYAMQGYVEYVCLFVCLSVSGFFLLHYVCLFIAQYLYLRGE